MYYENEDGQPLIIEWLKGFKEAKECLSIYKSLLEEALLKKAFSLWLCGLGREDFKLQGVEIFKDEHSEYVGVRFQNKEELTFDGKSADWDLVASWMTRLFIQNNKILDERGFMDRLYRADSSLAALMNMDENLLKDRLSMNFLAEVPKMPVNERIEKAKKEAIEELSENGVTSIREMKIGLLQSGAYAIWGSVKDGGEVAWNGPLVLEWTDGKSINALKSEICEKIGFMDNRGAVATLKIFENGCSGMGKSPRKFGA